MAEHNRRSTDLENAVLENQFENLENNFNTFKEEVNQGLSDINFTLGKILESKKEVANTVLFIDSHKDAIAWAKDTKRQTEKIKIKIIGMLAVTFILWVLATAYTPITDWLSKFK